MLLMTPADNLVIILTIRIFPVVSRIWPELRETYKRESSSKLAFHKKVVNLSYFASVFEMWKTNLL